VSKAAKRERQRQNRVARREYEEAVAKRRRFWRSARTFGLLLIPIIVLFAFLALRNNGNDNSSSSSSNDKKSAPTTLPAPSGNTIDPTKTYTAKIETNVGTIELALDAQNAPTSVNNFVYLTQAGFYDGLDFNRAVKDFVIQTGSPSNTTQGGPGYTVQAELPQDNYAIGSVAWAKADSDAAGTAGSQFFIGTGSNITSLPKDYGYIGTVKSGLDVAQKIMGYAPSSGDGTPTKKVTMKKVTITES